MSGEHAQAAVVINVSVIPPVVWLDTPERTAVAEAVLQRSKFTLRRYEKRGLKIHVFPGQTESGERSTNGDREFIIVAEYIEFLKTISE